MTFCYSRSSIVLPKPCSFNRTESCQVKQPLALVRVTLGWVHLAMDNHMPKPCRVGLA